MLARWGPLRGDPATPHYAPRRAGDLRAAYFAVQRARDELGWQPRVTLEDGLRETVDWFRSGSRSGVPALAAE